MKSEAGQTTIEYGLIIVIFSISLIFLLYFMAGSVTSFYSNVADLVANSHAP